MTEECLAALLGQRLKAARKAAGLTLDALTKKAGVSQRGYITWEEGVQLPRLDTLLKVANFHGMTLAQLFADEK